MAEEFLLVTDGASQGKRVDLTGAAVVIGREEGTDLVLDDSQASRRHAEVTGSSGSWSVRDLGSTNGTFVNGTRLTGEQALRPGDEIRIGRSRIALRST
ncbi:MAG TPA: FHA domain-containing protein, partial [Miltoncostaeaceae bacterium]|nr:FHA domain-containing protein [Miltoncostaeaceae bacterium]